MSARDNGKRLELDVAKYLGTHRTPLSGSNSRHTGADTLHPRLFIECKYRQRTWLGKLYDAVRTVARKEGKPPVIATRDARREGWLWTVHRDDLLELAREVEAAQAREGE